MTVDVILQISKENSPDECGEFGNSASINVDLKIQ